ncbi:CaiB/BaiF CoA transferase family protein [Alicycliphilus denitrificans]|uniref:Formyl-CoA transferase n=1 Tax=Alicycliphilus denitrificans (strain DSM 14773 / CIP 107495 / K601) TaxID=596154 RepID=F4GFG4_ALIDK|nr:CoA transferase [Alicycliphilus denitrificans]AEB83896.1 Formyl-CoA transferase [Alicycliphilus denitrificans K601]
MNGPLEGLRILDLTSNFMGPYASLLLADMGADVCKIEPPEGDTTRNVGPCRHKGMGAVFLHLNRNKRSIVLDLKHPDGLAALRRMLPRADVLLFSLRPQAMARLGLSYEAVREINPRIVYCGAFGFGQNGPYADRPAYDNLIQAAVGLPMTQARKTGGPPTYVGTAIVDRMVGMATSNAILAALHCRSQTGYGQAVEVPMFETFAHFAMGDHLYGHTFVPPIGDWGYERMTAPERQPYRTADGYVSVEVYTDRHWQRLFAAVGRADMAADPRYADVHARARHMGELYDFLHRTFATRPSAEWVALLTEADIPAIAMNTPETLLDDAHMRAVGFFGEQEHPSEGLLRTIGIPQQWSESPATLRHPAPRLGEHTQELLGEYGFGQDEIGTLLWSHGARAAAPAETAA